MLTKIEQLKQAILSYIRRLSDVRSIGLMLFLVVLFLITWSGVKAIETNYGLQKDISRLEQQNAVKKLANENLKLKNQYYNTPEYLDVAARQNFGLASPGETVVIVPRRVALAHTVELKPATTDQSKVDNKPGYQRNFDAWMDFFFHRQSEE